MRCLWPGKDRLKSKIMLIENNCVITDSFSVAEIFTIYFSEVAGNDGDRLEIEDFKDHPSINVIAERNALNQNLILFLQERPL